MKTFIQTSKEFLSDERDNGFILYFLLFILIFMLGVTLMVYFTPLIGLPIGIVLAIMALFIQQYYYRRNEK